MAWYLGPRPPLRESVRVPAPDRWRVVAYDFEGKVAFVAAEFARPVAELIAAEMFERGNINRVDLERVTRERGTP